MSCLFLLNAIYKQVGVDSEMCSDIDTEGRMFSLLFFLMDYTKYLTFAIKRLEIVRWITVSFNSVITTRKNGIITALLSKHGDELNQNVTQY